MWREQYVVAYQGGGVRIVYSYIFVYYIYFVGWRWLDSLPCYDRCLNLRELDLEQLDREKALIVPLETVGACSTFTPQ